MTETLEIPQYAPLLTALRNERVESFHRGVIAVVDEAGELLFEQGDSNTTVFTRSSLKPLQALPLVLTGAADAFELTQRELALVCSSHSSEPMHTEAVRGLLDKGELDEKQLVCGPQWPISRQASHELWCDGQHSKPGGIYNNCSGKHAGQLLTCLHADWDLDSYHLPDHPLQQYIKRLLTELLGLDEEQIGHGYDGCGLSNWAIPLRALARLFSLIAAAMAEPGELDDAQREVLDSIPHSDALRRVGRAMNAHPEMVAGSAGRFDSALMPALGDAGLTKTGAEGIQATGVNFGGTGRESVTQWLQDHPGETDGPDTASVAGLSGELRSYLDRGSLEERDFALGIAVKVADGDYRYSSGEVEAYSGVVRSLITVELLEQFGLLDPAGGYSDELARFADKTRRNKNGKRVGEYRTLL